MGAALQRRGGVARHDAVAWGYARAADALGVDIIQGCEVTGIKVERGRVDGRRDDQAATIKTEKVGCVTAGHSSVVAAMAGFRLPIESFPLQALVSEPVKPIMPCVVMSNTVHAYISQSDKGELVIGAGTDAYTSYSQRGGFHIIEHTLEAICRAFPDVPPHADAPPAGAASSTSPPTAARSSRKTPVRGFYINCGWGTGGFKATPGSGHVFAHTIANDEPHPINAPFTLERFIDGRLIDEAAAAAVAH